MGKSEGTNKRQNTLNYVEQNASFNRPKLFGVLLLGSNKYWLKMITPPISLTVSRIVVILVRLKIFKSPDFSKYSLRSSADDQFNSFL